MLLSNRKLLPPPIKERRRTLEFITLGISIFALVASVGAGLVAYWQYGVMRDQLTSGNRNEAVQKFFTSAMGLCDAMASPPVSHSVQINRDGQGWRYTQQYIDEAQLKAMTPQQQTGYANRVTKAAQETTMAGFNTTMWLTEEQAQPFFENVGRLVAMANYMRDAPMNNSGPPLPMITADDFARAGTDCTRLALAAVDPLLPGHSFTAFRKLFDQMTTANLTTARLKPQ